MVVCSVMWWVVGNWCLLLGIFLVLVSVKDCV